MSEHDIEFTREDIDTYLKELAKRFRKLNGTKMPGEIIIVGGAAVLLRYDFRKQSRDIDGIIRASSAIKESINYVADKYNLPRGCLIQILLKHGHILLLCMHIPNITKHIPMF